MNGLQGQVKEVLHTRGLTPDVPLLLACSGGMDSMVLLHVLLSLEYRPAVAHVNFQLRGKESEGDESFIRDFCAEKGLAFFVQRFSTEEEAEQEGESIQMAARRLRYTWLFELAKKGGYKRVLTAHHDRDQAETLLLNLMRGTGPQGLQGMLVDDGRLLRPMLRVEYPNVLAFSKTFKVAFRQDRSNAETKYKRNFIRHTLLQPWEERYPGTVHQINRSSEIMEECNHFLNNQLNKELQPYLSTVKKEIHIDYALAEHPSARLLMRHALKEACMTDQVPFILQARLRPGAIFSSDSHRLLADRKAWIVKEKEGIAKEGYEFKEIPVPFSELVSILPKGKEIKQFSIFEHAFSLQKWNPDYPKIKDARSILLSAKWVEQALYFRTWKKGDKMHPFGMKGSKKLSDLFVDAAIDRFQKETIPVLCSEKGEILWAAGVRSSELLRINTPTEDSWILSLEDRL